MKRTTKILSLTFILALLLGFLMFHASAATIIDSGYCGDEGTNLQWKLDTDGTLTISGSGNMKDYSYSWSNNTSPWYNYRNSITSVKVNDGVNSIGALAFAYCNNLSSIVIEDTVTSIGDSAFFECWSLTEINLPASVTTISGFAFDFCSNLENIQVSSNNLNYTSEDGILFNGDKTTLVCYPAGKTAWSYRIPATVTTIGQSAFSCCDSLWYIFIPSSVQTINSYAFSGCSALKEITIPEGIRSIGELVFQHCSSLTKVDLPNSLVCIWQYAFYGCNSLTEITVPSNVVELGDCAFWGCDSLASVYFNGPAPIFVGDSIFESNTTLYYIPANSGWTNSSAYNASAGTWYGYKLDVWENISGYCGGDGDGTNLQWTLNTNGTMTISGSGNMKDYTYDWIDAPWYDYRNFIKSINFNDGISSIGDYAFTDCSNLTSITIPASVTHVSGSAFDISPNLTTIQISSNNPYYTTVNGILFTKDTTTLVCYPAGKTASSYTVPATVTTIGQCAFSCAKLQYIYIPDSVQTINSFAFSGCTSLKEITIPEGVKGVQELVFQHCSSLTKVDLPDSLLGIGDYAFYGCTALKEITVPEDVVELRDCAFLGCDSLASVYFKGPAPFWYVGDSVFENNTTLYYIPANSGWTDSSAYNASTGTWNGYKLAVWEDWDVIASGYCGEEGDVTSLKWKLDNDGTLTISGTGYMGDYTYYYTDDSMPWHNYQNYITKVVIEDGVLYIGSYAFIRCANVTSVSIPESVSSFGEGAFECCSSLSSVVIPGAVVIRDRAFSGCTELTSVVIGNAQSIGEHAFSGCTKLSSVTFSDNLCIIGFGAFECCSALTSVVIPSFVFLIDDCAFSGCTGLTSVTFGSGSRLQTIGNGAFNDCKKLTSVIIPDTVTTIEDYAFRACEGLSAVYFEGNAPSVSALDTDHPSFSGSTTLYYTPGTTGWTDSSAYNASTGKWNGYKLAVWGYTEPDPIPYQFTTSMTASLELESEVFLNVAPQMTDLDGKALTAAEAQAIEGNVGMLIWDAATAPAEADATIGTCDNVILGATYNTSTKRFDVKSAGIAAKNLGDSLTIRAFYKDGDQVIYGKYVAGYSPKKYCYNQITKAAATKDVCIALLNYGAAAQVYFGHNTENMMNSELTANQKIYDWDGSLVRNTWTVSASKEGSLKRQNPPINSRGGSLELEGAINVVFTGGVTSSTKVSKAQLLIWNEADFKAVTVLTANNATEIVDMTKRADGKYEYIYKGVPAKDMFQTIYTCQMYTDINGNVYYGGVLPMCAERYAFMNQYQDNGLAELVQTMIVYGDAARDYFG